MSDQAKIQTKEYYDKRFGSQSQTLNEEEIIRWQAIERSLKENSKEKGILIADFGCGRGWISKKLSEFGKVTGFDISEKSIQNAKKSFPDVEFICLDASNAVPEMFKQKFDLVVSSEVIEHLQDQKTYLNNINYILKADGMFIITTPNGKWYNAFYQNERKEWKQPIENWLEADKLAEILGKAGMKVVKQTTFNSEWIFDHQPYINPSFLSNPFLRKSLKALGLFAFTKENLNKRNYGLNLLMIGIKERTI